MTTGRFLRYGGMMHRFTAVFAVALTLDLPAGAFISGRVARPTTPREILASAAKRPLEAKPGTTWIYSNTGYVLLGLVVEAVAHRPLAKYERERILGPAKMTSTTMGDAPAGAP